jgi:uncharacterized membrane protein
MNNSVSILGVILIIVGALALAYQGFTYTKQDQVAKVGSLEVTANTEKSVHLPPYIGGLVLVGGILLVVVGRKR